MDHVELSNAVFVLGSGLLYLSISTLASRSKHTTSSNTYYDIRKCRDIVLACTKQTTDNQYLPPATAVALPVGYLPSMLLYSPSRFVLGFGPARWLDTHRLSDIFVLQM